MRHKSAVRWLTGTAVALGAALTFPAHAGKTLDTIKQRGALVCGVNTGLAGFSAADSQGNWTGLDVDICKAIAASMLSDANKVKWVPLNARKRFTALQSGEVDILSRNTTWTLTRDASLGLDFVGVTYYDGQGFMVPKKTKITSAKQSEGCEVCVQSGTTTEKNLTDYYRSNDLKMKPVVFEGFEASVKAFFSGRCQAYTTDASGLASIRNKEASNPDDYVILPELISKEPLGPGGAPRRRRVVRDRQVGGLRADRSRGIRDHAGQRRQDEGEHRSGRAAHPRHVGGHRQAARPRQGVGVPRDQGRRQLRRDLRAQRRAELAAEAAARAQQPVEQGRHHVRAADSLNKR